jgi:hypothetical protein
MTGKSSAENRIWRQWLPQRMTVPAWQLDTAHQRTLDSNNEQPFTLIKGRAYIAVLSRLNAAAIIDSSSIAIIKVG